MRRNILSLFFLLIISISVFSQNEKGWNFIIKPGTEEWNNLKS